jgi:predicted permease
MRALGRLKPGVRPDRARADFDQILDRLESIDPGPEDGHHAFLQLLSEQVTGEVGQSLWALMAAAGLLLLIACANVAGLLVARNLARTSELAIRMAIGAGRGRLTRELLTESLAFAIAGGVCGILAAGWCTKLLVSIAPAEIPRLGAVGVHGEVLAFAIAATMLTGLMAGLAPVWSAQRGINLVEVMQSSARSATSSRSSLSVRACLVSAEIAVTLVLVFGAVVLLRSLGVAQNRNPGFEPSHLLALESILPQATYPTGQSRIAFYEQLREHVAALPGVESAALVNGPPALGARMDWFYSIAGKPAPKNGEVPVAILNVAGPGYFSTAGIALRGRDFTTRDAPGAPCTAVVNQTLARNGPLEPGASVKVGGPYMKGDLCEVIGIAADVGQIGLDQEVKPEIYLSFAQSPQEAMVLMVRTRPGGESEAMSRLIRREVERLGPNVPILSLRPVTTLLASSLDRRRFGTFLFTAFAGLALVLAAIGIYGLLDFWVGMRRREIALRLALGASRSAILRWTGWQTARLVLVGSMLGLTAAYVSSRWLESLFYGVSAGDFRLLAVAALTVIAIGGVASAIPLWRAVQVVEAEQLHRS